MTWRTAKMIYSIDITKIDQHSFNGEIEAKSPYQINELGKAMRHISNHMGSNLVEFCSLETKNSKKRIEIFLSTIFIDDNTPMKIVLYNVSIAELYQILSMYK